MDWKTKEPSLNYPESLEISVAQKAPPTQWETGFYLRDKADGK